MSLLAVDDFDRADGGLGGNWTTTTGIQAPQIVSNEALAGASNSVGGARHTGYAGWPNNQYASILIGSVVATQSDEGAGPACRIASGANTQYFAQTNTTQTRLYKVVAGTYTQLGSDGAACVAGDELRLECVGTSISVKRQGSVIIGPVTDAAIAAGDAGLWTTRHVTGGTTAAASWAGGDFATGGGALSRVERGRTLARGLGRGLP
jgi:hypothetical protein